MRLPKRARTGIISKLSKRRMDSLDAREHQVRRYVAVLMFNVFLRGICEGKKDVMDKKAERGSHAWTGVDFCLMVEEGDESASDKKSTKRIYWSRHALVILIGSTNDPNGTNLSDMKVCVAFVPKASVHTNFIQNFVSGVTDNIRPKI